MESGLQSVWAVCGAGVRASASKFSEAQPLHHSTSHTFLQGTTRLFQWESTEMTLLEAVWRDGEQGLTSGRQRLQWVLELEVPQRQHSAAEQALSLGLGTGCPVMGEQGPGPDRGWALSSQDAGRSRHDSEDADRVSEPLVDVEGVGQVT